MTENKAIAFFDFDGTITRKDIFGDFIKFRLKKGLSKFRFCLCFPYVVLFKLKLISNEIAKEKVFGLLFGNEDVSEFKASANQYVTENLPALLRASAIDRINWHLQQGHLVYVVSANFEDIVIPFAGQYGIKALSTQLAKKDNKITGKFSGPNCYGPQKVVRIMAEKINLASYQEIYAYGDSKGDKEMLAIATQPFYRYFND